MINELLIRVTYKCNKNCDFCFNNIFDDKIDNNLKEEIDTNRIINFIKKHHIETTYLSGGEPTVYKDIKNLSKQLSKESRIVYFTNGLLFERFTMKDIKEMNISAINMSVYTGEIINNDETFRKKCNMLRQFKEECPNTKLFAQVMIDKDFFSVINSEGYKQLEEIFNQINWQPLAIPEGHSLYKNTLEGMNPRESNEIISYLKEKLGNKKASIFEDIIKKNINQKCWMGKKYITINPDMTISICPHKNDKTLSIEEYEELESKTECFNIGEECLSMRCVSLKGFLDKKYGTIA